MTRIYIKLLFCFSALLVSLSGFAQSATVSPYSYYGIGDLQNQVGSQGFAMGNTGIALHNDSTTPYFLNLKNPASYFFNRITTFEAGILDEQFNLNTMGQSHNNNNAYFGYFALAFPAGKHFGGSIGLVPMSSVGYNLSVSNPLDSITPTGQKVPVDNTSNTYIGTGGINKVFIGLAFSPQVGIFKGLSIGAHASFLFGSLTYSSVTSYSSNYNAFYSNVYENTQVKSFYPDFGLQWTFGKPKGFNVTLGATMGIAWNVNASYSMLAYNTLNGGLAYDTIKDSNVNGTLHLPLFWGAGFTIKATERWTFTGEYSTQQWSQYTYFDQNPGLTDSKHYGFGIQYVPHRNSDQLHSYFQRVHYRAGFYMDQTNLNLNNTPINDYCASIGAAMPVGHYYPMLRAAILNIGLQAGQLGTTNNNLLRERYLKLLISITFDDRWFIKRQYE